MPLFQPAPPRPYMGGRQAHEPRRLPPALSLVPVVQPARWTFLPKPTHLDSISDGAIKLLAYLIDFAAHIAASGGTVMTSPLPIVNDSNNLWGDELNAYLTELEAQVPLLGASGYGVGFFGVGAWDMTAAPASAYSVLSHGVIVPNIATVGWGKELNDTFFTPLNSLIDRVVVLENA